MHPRSFVLGLSIWIKSTADSTMMEAALIRKVLQKVLMPRCELSAVLGSNNGVARRIRGKAVVAPSL
jgi:hypothetical protein